MPGAASPHDNIALKIFYPALPDDGEEQRSTGVVPADRNDSPFPVVIFMPGINVGPESYAWLAQRLALAGIVTVTYTHVAEEMPGYVSLTPGLDISAIGPDSYGERPSATVIGPIIDALEAENAAGVLGGMLDLDNIVLAGHSGGGSVAIFNSNPAWFPGVKGAVAYGAHGAAATMLGYDEGTVLRLADSVPIMLIAGTRDGVIANSAARYGDEPGDALARVRDTFERGIAARRGDCFLVEIEGANHFSIARPRDESTGRSFLDWHETRENRAIRELISELIERFVTKRDLEDLVGHELVSSLRQK